MVDMVSIANLNIAIVTAALLCLVETVYIGCFEVARIAGGFAIAMTICSHAGTELQVVAILVAVAGIRSLTHFGALGLLTVLRVGAFTPFGISAPEMAQPGSRPSTVGFTVLLICCTLLSIPLPFELPLMFSVLLIGLISRSALRFDLIRFIRMQLPATTCCATLFALFVQAVSICFASMKFAHRQDWPVSVAALITSAASFGRHLFHAQIIPHLYSEVSYG